MLIFLYNWEQFKIEFFLIFSIIFLILSGLYFKRFLKDKNISLINYLVFSFVIVGCSLLFLNFNFYLIFLENNYIFMGLFYNLNNNLIVMQLILICFTLLVALGSFNYLKLNKVPVFEFYLLLYFLLLSSLIMIRASDFLMLYLAIEFQSLILYIFASSKKYSITSSEAGLKYFIQGAFASIILLLGFSLIYYSTGLTKYSDFWVFFQNYSVKLNLITSDFNLFFQSKETLCLVSGILLVLFAFFFKLSIFPFSIWLPDVYYGSPLLVTMVFTILPKLGMFQTFYNFIEIFIFEFNFIFNDGSSIFIYLISFFIFISIIIGSIGALFQEKLKRILAFSTISNSGFMLLPLVFNSIYSYETSLFFVLIYSFVNFSLFYFLILVNSQNFNKIKSLKDLLMLKDDKFIIGGLLAIVLFSVAGIPPLLGFYSKAAILLYCFFYANILNSSFFYFILLFLIFFSVISVFYYLRLIRKIFFNKSYHPQFFCNINIYDSFMIYFLLFINTGLFFCWFWNFL